MKKLFNFILILTFIFNFSIMVVDASTETFTRTDEDLLVNDWITDVESKKSYIMSTPAVDAKEKIYDFADLLTDSEEKELYNKVSRYIGKNNSDLAIVTINENNKYSAQDYADDFYDYNDFGNGSDRTGCLLLVDMDTREIYISTNGGAINAFTDEKINFILDDTYSYLTDKEYYTGIDKTVSLMNEYYSKSLAMVKDSGSRIIYSLVISGIITAIILGIMISKNKLVRPATTARENLDKKNAVVNNIGDVFTGTNTVRHKIEHSSSSSGGGSSIHTSSSGGSHGGGGHRF